MIKEMSAWKVSIVHRWCKTVYSYSVHQEKKKKKRIKKRETQQVDL